MPIADIAKQIAQSAMIIWTIGSLQRISPAIWVMKTTAQAPGSSRMMPITIRAIWPAE